MRLVSVVALLCFSFACTSQKKENLVEEVVERELAAGPGMDKVALLVIDIQNDFLKGGNLAVGGGNEIIDLSNRLIGLKGKVFDYVFATQDWHPEGHISFASSHNGELFSKKKVKFFNQDLEQTLWPDHCVQGSKGAEFHKDLLQAKFDGVIRKGVLKGLDSYSAFFGNDGRTATGLDFELKKRNVGEVYVIGLAKDYCVNYTAQDAKSLGYVTYVIEDATRGVAEKSSKEALGEWEAKGVKVVQSGDIFKK